MNPERPDQSPITSPRSERVRRIAALSGRSARRKQGQLRVEGPQAVRSLLAHRPELALELFLTARAADDHPELARLAAEAGVPTREVDETIIRAMTREPGGAEGQDRPESGAAGAVSPQGAIAVARLPEESAGAALAAVAALPAEGPLTAVVLHEVRDPGNVGTLLRTADAAGADDLGSIVDRVMGPPTPPRLRGGAAAHASVDSLSLRYAAGSDRGHDRGESLSSQVELLPFGAHTPSPLTLTNPDAHTDDDAPPTPTPNRTWAGRAPTPTKTWLQRSPRDRSSGGGTSAHGHEASFGQAT